MQTPSLNSTETIILSPSYRVPLGLGIIALGSLVLAWWLAAFLFLFALFLAFQAATLKLTFTDSALCLYRGETQLRQFPYTEWQHWQIFWPPVPILFYFREVKSIHFLPILFDPVTLQACLEGRCPRMVKPSAE
jgi:hypothetical protein